MRDTTRCAILMRENKKLDWALVVFTEKVSDAFKSAQSTAEQEWHLGNQRFQTKVITEQDYDAGKLDTCLQLFRFKAPVQPEPPPDIPIVVRQPLSSSIGDDLDL